MPGLTRTIPQLDPDERLYYYALINAPGVAAANNFLTLLNPAGSGRVIRLISVLVENVASVAQSVTVPMVMSRCSAVSGGATVTNTTSVCKGSLTDAVSVAELRINNPTATLGANAFTTAPNAINNVSGAGAYSVLRTPVGGLLYLRPGEGVIWRTASGSTAQFWNICPSWGEAPLTEVS